MNPKIKSVEIEGEKIYLKKSGIMGWGVIYPWQKEDGSINWYNLITGGTPNLIKTIFIVAMLLLLILGVKEMIDPLRAIAEQPVEYCRQVWDTFVINLSKSSNPTAFSKPLNFSFDLSNLSNLSTTT